MKFDNSRSLLKIGEDPENNLIEYYKDHNGKIYKRIPRKFLESGNSAQYIEVDESSKTT